MTEDQGSETNGDDSGGRSAGSGLTLDKEAISFLTTALESLENVPGAAPENFEMVYAEMEGKVGSLTVMAVYEDGGWTMNLDQSGDQPTPAPSGDSESEDKGQDEQGGDDQQHEGDEQH